MSEMPGDETMNLVLERSTLFRNLDKEEIERIGKNCEVIRFGAGQDIICEGDTADHMYVIGEGEVALIKRMGQSEHELMRLGPGEHFGEMAMISAAVRSP